MSTNITGISAVVAIEVTDWHSLGWWFAEQSSVEQAEFLHAFALHLRDGFLRPGAGDEPDRIQPGEAQLHHIAKALATKGPRSSVNLVQLALLELVAAIELAQ